MPGKQEQEYVSGPFRLVPARQELLREGRPVPLGGRAFDLLHALMQRPGRLITKEELFDAVWPGIAVEDSNLTVTMSAVRRALGCGVDGARYVSTVAGRGYRFVAPVEPVAPGEPAPAALAPAALASAALAPAAPGPAAAADEPRTNLPRSLSSLIGRDAAVAQALAMLQESRLVTVTGPGGIGKSRLALAVGEAALEAFPDGVWLVDLADLTAPELVAEAIAARFRLNLAAPREAVEIVASALGDRRLLLILDNCEHLVDPVARVVEAILRGGSEARVLAASREPLKLPGEQVHRLAPLACPEAGDTLTATEAAGYSAIRLFVERARLTVGDFALTDQNAPVVAGICRALDGLALAIELAAPRLQMLTAEALRDRLSDRFGLLTRGPRTALPRQQTLKATLDWSHNLLSLSERILLRRLGAFGGSFTLAGAAAVAADEAVPAAEILDLLDGLIDKSLVAPLPAAGGERRHRLLESIRQYAGDRLAEAGETEATNRRLARYLTGLFQGADEEWLRTPTEAWVARYAPEVDTLRGSLTWAFGPDGDTALGLRLVSQTDELWRELSLLRERRRWFETAMARTDDSTPLDVLGRILLGLAFTGAFGQRRKVDLALQAVAVLRQIGDSLWLGRALHVAGTALARPDDVSEAEHYMREAEALLRPLGNTKVLAPLLDSLGTFRFMAGDRAGGRRYAEESLALARSLGLKRGIETTTMNLAEHDFADGDIAGAIARAREAEAACRASGNRTTLSYVLTNLTAYLLAAGREAEAARTGREALRLVRVSADESMVISCLEHLALAAARTGDLLRAAQLSGYADAFYRSRGQVRQNTEQQTAAAIAERLAALPAERRAALAAEGAAWTEDEATAAALAE